MSAHRPAPDNGARGNTVSPVIGKAAGAVGVVFLLVGILGFIPGITTNYEELEFAGHMSEAQLLGLFQVSILHNIVHLAYGVVGLAVVKNAPAARTYFIAGGVIYLVLWIYGLAVAPNSDANFVPLDSADNWLHLGLGVGMIALGVLPGRRAATGAERPA